MAAQPEPTRDEEIKAIHKKYQFFYAILGGLFLVVLGIWLGWQMFPSNKIIDYNINLWNTLIGTSITILVLDRRAEYREEKRLKAQLVREAGGQSNEAAKRAVDELRAHKWIRGSDSLLQKIKLVGANLQEANLVEANLQQTQLIGANLQRADLVRANLQKAVFAGIRLKHGNSVGTNLQQTLLAGVMQLQQEGLTEVNLQQALVAGISLQGPKLWAANLQQADLTQANLKQAILFFTNLQQADLTHANLQEAFLTGANLQQADLTHANLQGVLLNDANLQEANLSKAQFDESSILPDGTFWIPDIDLSRFTDPDHPEFWRSGNSMSPAYCGKTSKEG